MPTNNMIVSLRGALRSCRTHFVAAFWFQGFVAVSALAYPLYMIQVYERVIPSRNVGTLLALLTGAALVIVLSGTFDYLNRKLRLAASLRVDRLLASKTLAALFLRNSSERSDTGGQVLRDLGIARNFYTRVAPDAITGLPWATLFLGVLFYINFLVGIAALICLGIECALTALNVVATKRSREEAVEAGARSQRMIEANLRSSDSIVAMGILPRFLAKWQRVDDAAMNAEAKGGTLSSAFSAISSVLSTIMRLSILSVAAVAIMAGALSPGFAFAVIIAFSLMMRPLKDIVRAWEQYPEAKASAGRVDAVLSAYPDQGERTVLPRPKGEVTCRRAVFMAPGGERILLGGISFGIAPGSAVGIVGAIGSGKTTLARLLVGLQPPTRGEVRIDGTEAALWDREQLGRYIGYLPQDIGLIAGTVAENIGRLGMFDDQQIVAAAELAGAHNIISKLPQGYDTLIGEGGVPLSGGQKQLVGLARAIAGSPSVVVLDEPNSNLDGPGENALLQCVQALKAKGCTVILISHRPSIVQTLERVILIKEGAVAFDGPVSDFFEASGRPAIRVIKANEAQT